MQNSIKCLDKIIENAGDEWKKKLDNFLKDDKLEEDTVLGKAFIEFIDACKEDVIHNNENTIKEIELKINNDLLFNDTITYVKELLNVYYAAEEFRILEKKDYKLAERAVDIIFQQAIVRYNPSLDESYADYGFASKEGMVKIINVLDSLTTFAITNNLYITSVDEAVYQNIRLSRNMCQYIAGKVDEAFDQIRWKLITEKVLSDS